MATWMLHAVAATAALTVAGLLTERALEQLRRPTRGLWLAVLAASAVWPFAASAFVRAGAAPVVATGSGGAVVAAAADTVAAGALSPDAWLLGAWIGASLMLVVVLLLSAETLKQDRRRWYSAVVGGEIVAVSGWLGPAVVGIGRARIVLPRWVLGLDDRMQRLIVLHEREHVRAGDSRALAAGLLIVCLLPWCLPLWWQFHRLRMALETDCDRRLLASGVCPREYAHALLAVARRRRRVLLPLAAMSSSRNALERRIRLMAPVGSARMRGRRAGGLLTAAVALFVGVAALPLPPAPSFSVPDALMPRAAGGAGHGRNAPRADGTLAGDPGQERLAQEIGRHHPSAVAGGVPPGSIVWFIADRSGHVRHTGIERGTDRAVIERLHARYRVGSSALVMAWSGVPLPHGTADVVWLIDPRPRLVSGP